MAKYLFQGSYTEQGLKGLIKEGGSKRRQVVEQLAKSMGATLEVFYYAFGMDDFFIIMDVPDHVTATAASLIVNATGTVKVRTTVLISAEEVDAATKKTLDFRPVGQ
jgi:uncharacterized protein with GYD domain